MKNKLFFIAFALLLLCKGNVYSQSADGTLTVLSYNCSHGFEGDSTTIANYLKWVKQHNPDVVAYQEMIGFSKDELASFAKLYGHRYSVIMSQESGYDVTHPIAITSKYPIENVEMRNKEMWHGYVYAKVKGVNILVTHLAPFTLKDRQKDMDDVLNRVKELPANEMVLIAGDFNSLSRFDRMHYGPELLMSLKKLEGRLEPKSGTPIVKNKIIYRNNLNNGQIDYSVTDKMQDGGFFDSYYLIHKSFKNSVPVKSQLKKNSVLRRVDYIWVNAPLSKHLLEADIVHDEITDIISDHYPVIIKFKLK